MWSSQEYLPLEILEKIIEHLDITSLKAAGQVCQYWKTVAEQEFESSKYDFFEGNIQIKKEQLIPGSSDVSEILFVGYGLVILRIRQKDKESGLESIRVYDESSNRTWNVEMSSIISGEGNVRADATDKIVILGWIGGSFGIWSRNGHYVTKIEEENIDFKASDSRLLLLHPNSQFETVEVDENYAVERVKYSNSISSAIMIRDFCNPFLLVEVRNCKLRVIGINKKKKETFVVSPKVQTSVGWLAGYEQHVGYETKIETPLIFCIEINGNRHLYHTLCIFDFDGNKLFQTSTSQVWSGGGLSNLKVVDRMGTKTLFYHEDHYLVMMALDPMIKSYRYRGKEEVIEHIQYANSDWQSKKSRKINLRNLDCPTQSSYFFGTSSISFAGVDTKLFFKGQPSRIKKKKRNTCYIPSDPFPPLPPPENSKHLENFKNC